MDFQIQIDDKIAVDIRNRQVKFPGLVDYIQQKLSTQFKTVARQKAFSPAGSSSGVLAGITGESYAKAFFYHRTSRPGASLSVYTLSAQIANIFEGSGQRGLTGKFPIMKKTIEAFQAVDPEAIIAEALETWSEAESESAFRNLIDKRPK